MASLTIRGLDDETRDRLRVRAAQHGRSMEAEVRAILHDLLSPSADYGLGSRIHARFAAIEGAVDSEGLDVPPRRDAPRAALFEQ